MPDDDWLVGWGLGYAAVGGASVLVPLYAVERGAGALTVGLIAASAALAGVPGAVLWGRLAARTRRRRPFVLAALGATAAVLAAFWFLRSPWAVLVANAGLWFVVSAAAPVLNLVVVEGVPESRWGGRLGRLNAAQGYGWVAGLLVGTAWTALGPVGGTLRPLFPLLAGVAALGLAVVRARYPERPTTDPARFRRAFRRLADGPGAGRAVRALPYGPSRLYWALVSRRGDGRDRPRETPLRRYLVAVALFSTGFAVFWGPMPAFLTGAGYPSGDVFVLFLLANVGSAACYALAGRVAERVDPAAVQRAALAARAVLFPSVPPVAAALGRLAFQGLGAGFLLVGVTWAFLAVTGPSLVGRLSASERRSEALGAQAALAGLGTGVGSALGGGVAAVTGFGPAFVLAGGLVLAGLVAVPDGRAPRPAGPDDG